MASVASFRPSVSRILLRIGRPAAVSPIALLLGLAFAALTGVLLLAFRGREAWRQALPLAPFLAAGALPALLP